MTVFTPISHDAFVDAVRTVAALLARDAGWRPSFLIGVGRGGLAPAVYLSHATGVPMLSIDHSAQVEEFADQSLVTLARRTRAGDRLLFVDDINDSGRTIAHLRRALADAGASGGSIRFATLIDNVRSAERVDYTARTIDRRETKDWFVFPWESVAPPESLAGDAAAIPDRIA